MKIKKDRKAEIKRWEEKNKITVLPPQRTPGPWIHVGYCAKGAWTSKGLPRRKSKKRRLDKI